MIHPELVDWKLRHNASATIAYCIMSEGIPDSHPPVSITHVLSFCNDQWSLWVHSRLVEPALLAYLKISLPSQYTSESLNHCLRGIDDAHVCVGAGLFDPADVDLKTMFVDDFPTPQRDGTVMMGAVRDIKCKLIVPVDVFRCPNCTTLKEQMRQKAYRKAQPKPVNPSKFTPNTLLSTPEKLKKLASLARDKIEFRRKVASLTAKVQALHSKGLTVDETLDGDLVSIMQSESSKVQDTLPDGSFRKLFWQEQMKALSCRDPHQRRWHLMIIKWCLNLRMLSTAAYHNMRTMGMSRRALNV